MEKTNLEIELKNAYRKWKSSAYFDPFLVIDANKIAFRENREGFFENYFSDFAEKLINEDTRNELFLDIYNNIEVRCLPKADKKVNEQDFHQKSNKNSKTQSIKLISNVPKAFKSSKIQYFIDLPLEAQVLGALWVMKYGCLLDNRFDTQSYGNRIRKTIKNSNNGPTPYLYYPYFKKYESWRDEAINRVEGLMDLGLNALMVSLDIEGYFYNCRIDFDKLKNSINESIEKNKATLSSTLEEFNFLNDFVEKIFLNYSKLFSFSEENSNLSKPFIPIGFLPSYVISNWYLDEFDKRVRKEINPVYYGRYVDDILMVFSLNDSSFNSSTEEDIINELSNLFHDVIRKEVNNNKSKDLSFEINSECTRDEEHVLRINKKKVKLFYFSHQHSRELINTFKENIAKSSSAFYFLQESDELIFEKHFSEIWKIVYSDTHNKIRSVEDLVINKFALSKWLAFLIYFSGGIESVRMNKLLDILFEILSVEGYLFHFNLWEKYLLFFFKHKKYDEIIKFCTELFSEIESLGTNGKGVDIYSSSSFSLKNNNETEIIKDTLKQMVYSIIQKTFALRNDADVKKISIELEKNLFKHDFLQSDDFRNAYFQSFMFNTLVIPYPLISYTAVPKYDLFKYNPQKIKHINIEKRYLSLFPRYIHLHEIQMHLKKYPIIDGLLQDKKYRENEFQKIWEWFWEINYGVEKTQKKKPFYCRNIKKGDSNTIIEVGENKKFEKLRIGIANVKVSSEVFENNLKGKSTFDTNIRNTISKIVNYAIKEKVDFLILPECYVNNGWINKLIRVAKDHQIGMVFGLEYIVDLDTRFAYNYLAILLPFKIGQFNNCVFDMRLKNHLSPQEEKMIHGYFLKKPKHRKHYTMYDWKGFNFAPYSCF